MARVIKLIALDYPVGYYAYSHVSLQEGGGEELHRHGGKEYKGGTEIEEKPALTMWAMSPQAKERGSFQKLRDGARILPLRLQRTPPRGHRCRLLASRTETIFFCCSEPPNYGNLLQQPQGRSQIHFVSFIPRYWVFYAILNGIFNFIFKLVIVSTEKYN